MSSTPPLSIRESSVADLIDLTVLENELQSIPEPLYLFHNYVSTKYGPRQRGRGSKVQVNRLLPLASPDPDNLAAYIAPDTRNGTPTATSNDLQSLNWSKVLIQVKRRRMPKPVAEKFETEQLSQVDIMMGHRVNLRRNYHEFIDDMIREEYRASVCTNIFGNSKRANAGDMTSDPSVSGDGLGVAMLKEFKRRAAILNIRAFGSVPGSDMQALTGSYLGITDQHGINEITEDPLWRDYAIRAGERTEDNLVKGFFGEYEQVKVVKSDRMRTVNVGPSGAPITGHEILFCASDPVLIEPGENGVQGFIGELPVVLVLMGMPEVKKASEDNFGEDLIYTWFQTMGVAGLEELTAAQAQQITLLLGNGFPQFGIAATGSSRFVHRGYFV